MLVAIAGSGCGAAVALLDEPTNNLDREPAGGSPTCCAPGGAPCSS